MLTTEGTAKAFIYIVLIRTHRWTKRYCSWFRFQFKAAKPIHRKHIKPNSLSGVSLICYSFLNLCRHFLNLTRTANRDNYAISCCTLTHLSLSNRRTNAGLNMLTQPDGRRKGQKVGLHKIPVWWDLICWMIKNAASNRQFSKDLWTFKSEFLHLKEYYRIIMM